MIETTPGPFVLCWPDGKRPAGKAWQNHGISRADYERAIAEGVQANYGLMLGPISDIIDLECDSPEAEQALRGHLGDEVLDNTPAWRSARGNHYAVKHDARLQNLPGVVKVGPIECRLGNGRAVQSLIPPSEVDGFKREWIRDFRTAVQPLPESFIQLLLATPEASQGNTDPDPLFRELHRELQQAKLRKLRTYCEKKALGITREHTRSDTGDIYLHLDRCPMKPDDSTGDGDPCFKVTSQGMHYFACRHAKCTDKVFGDVEEALGALNPVIRCGPDIQRMQDEALAALAAVPNIYQHGTLTQVVQDPPQPRMSVYENGSPKLVPVNKATLFPILSTAVRWEKWNEKRKKWVWCDPPEKVAAAIASSTHLPGIPVIHAVVSAPVLRPDGKIIAERGYDPSTGLYLDIDGEYPAPMKPDAAIGLLYDVIHDFPFANEKHRSAWVAALITLLARSAIEGSTPMLLFDANASRTGKGLGTDVITMISEGRKANRLIAPKDDEEMNKIITAQAMSGRPYIIFDNCKGQFGGKALENALTTGRWSGRVLGISKNVEIIVAWTWLATSNNARVTQDMVGRTLQIRMESLDENPGMRSGFRYPDLLAHVKQHRRELAIAALSIPAAYIRAGCPDQQLAAWGGFEAWSRLVRGSLVWAGLPDPDTRDQLADQADDDTATLRAIMEGWSELPGPMTIANAMDLLDSAPNDYQTLRDAIKQLNIRGPVTSFNVNNALGKLLQQSRKRVVGGRYFDRTDAKRPKWSLVPVKNEAA